MEIKKNNEQPISSQESKKPSTQGPKQPSDSVHLSGNSEVHDHEKPAMIVTSPHEGYVRYVYKDGHTRDVKENA